MRSRLAVLPVAVCLTSWAGIPVPIGPFGGSAAFVQVDPQQPETVLAATDNALLFRSTNGGESWTGLSFPASLRATLHALVVSPNTGVYLVGLSDDSRAYSGLFRSSDQGRTWSRMTALGSRDVWSVAVFPTDSRIVAAGTAEGVFLTRDGGEHWSRISAESNHALRPVVSLAFDPLDWRMIYAGTPHLPWRTVDGGASWKPASSGMQDDSDVFSIQVAEPLRHVFASACSGIYRSLDRGDRWTKLRGADGASYRTYQVVQDPLQRGVMFAATAHGLVKSSDSGTSWKRLSSEITRSIAFDPRHERRIYVATDAGLFRSDDLGETFRSINNGFCNRRVLSMAVARDGLYAGTAGGLLRRAGLKGAWQTSGPDADFRGEPVIKIAPLDEARLFVLTSNALLFSADRGRTWTNRSPAGTPGLTDIAVRPSRVVVANESGVRYSENGGKTWRAARMPRLDGGIRSLAPIGARGVAAATRSSLFLSSDGASYRRVTPPPGSGEIYGLVGTSSGGLIAASAQGLKRSDDGGLSWRSAGGELDGNTVSSICVHPTRPGVFFASRFGAIFFSTDDGRSWSRLTPEGEDLPSVKQLVVAPADPSHVFALTPSTGIYSIPIAGPSIKESN